MTSLPVIRAAGMSTRRRLNTVTFVALKTSDSGPQRAELQRQQDDDDTAMTHLLPHNINTIHTAQQRTVVESSPKSPTMRTNACHKSSSDMFTWCRQTSVSSKQPGLSPTPVRSSN